MKDRALAILSWVGWTSLGWQSMLTLYFLFFAFGLASEPAGGSTVEGSLRWLQALGGPFVGNIVIRRLVRAGWRWQRSLQSSSAS